MSFLFLSVLQSCSDYNFQSKVPGDDGTDLEDTPPGTTPVVPGEPCPTLSSDPLEVSIDESCTVEPQIGSFTPVVKWSVPSWPSESSFNNIMMTPIVISLNDDNGDGAVNQDDYADILVITFSGGGGAYDSGVLRAISGVDGSELWSVSGGHQITGTPAAADIDNDGLPEVVAPGQGELRVYENDGPFKWALGGLGGYTDTISDAPAIADLDADGQPEIVFGSAIISNAGILVGAGGYGIGKPRSNVGATPSVADIDLDGIQEVIVGNAYYAPDGSAKCTNGLLDGYTAVADFDADMEAEVVVSSGAGEIRLQDTDCAVIWTAYIPGSLQDYYGGPPTVADYDGDGLPEVGVAAANSYTVFDTDGSMLWQAATQDGSSGNTGSSVFDFEGDGIAEAIYPDESTVWAFNGPDGAVKLSFGGHSSGTWTEYSTIADIDNDNHAEIIVTHNNVLGGQTGVTVLEDADDSWQAGRRIWNQHAYSITNVNDDGSVPALPDPNWLTYNNFRSGDLAAATGGDQPDLYINILDICRNECTDNSITVLVAIGNTGTLDIDRTVIVSIYGVDASGNRQLLDLQFVNTVIPSGQQLAGIEVEVMHPLMSTFVDIVATVETDLQSLECHIENNETSWGSSVCQ